MARLSDIIENFIKDMLEGAEGKVLEIGRNELANAFNCAPSQINYVISTRFSLDKGYYVESRRGGGGFIKITRIDIGEDDYIKNIIWNGIGDSLGQHEAERYIVLFEERGIITPREARIMSSALNDKTIVFPSELRDALRARLLKTMLIAVLE